MRHASLKNDEVLCIQWEPVAKPSLWYFLKVRSTHKARLLRLLNQKQTVQLEEYGEVLQWGFDKPSASVVQMMVQRFGFKPEQAA